MSGKRVLTIQDISCVGECSLSIAMPIIALFGCETAVLPTAVLSTHTGGFKDVKFRDLSDDMPAINAAWQANGIRFDAIYSGYLGSAKQIDSVLEIVRTSSSESSIYIADPAMADNGKLYSGFDSAFVQEMKRLCSKADVILPNFTEACLLTDTPYTDTPDQALFIQLGEKLLALGAGCAVITGASVSEDSTGFMTADENGCRFYSHRKIGKGCFGTGDAFAACFTGAVCRGLDRFEAAILAAEFVAGCIEETAKYPDHWYGSRFEPQLVELAKRISELDGPGGVC